MTTNLHSARTAKAATHSARTVAVPETAARAHEQKNCLSIILAVASLVTPELSPEGRDRMQRLRAAAHRMRDLIDADLDDSSEAAHDVDIQALVDGVCDSLRDRAEAANVGLDVECAGGVVQGTEAELRESLFNLVSNAIDATPPHRRVVVQTTCSATGEHEWRIADRGVGMQPEVLEQIGVPYRSFRPGGSGLGVALACAVIERHGGTIRFDSVRGEGTTVTIRLPGQQRLPLSGVCGRPDAEGEVLEE